LSAENHWMMADNIAAAAAAVAVVLVGDSF